MRQILQKFSKIIKTILRMLKILKSVSKIKDTVDSDNILSNNTQDLEGKDDK